MPTETANYNSSKIQKASQNRHEGLSCEEHENRVTGGGATFAEWNP